jgi:hypothetical protein
MLRLRRGRRHRHSERSLLGTWVAAGDGALHGRHSWWRLCLLTVLENHLGPLLSRSALARLGVRDDAELGVDLILALLEAVSTERSPIRAARALAELMRHLQALGQRIAGELSDQNRDIKPARR